MSRFVLTSADVDRARECCVRYHAGQVRLGNNLPYHTHPFDVADTLARYGYDDPVTQILAYLHDAGEDSPQHMDEIDDLFGYEISHGVYILSRNKGKMADGTKLSQGGYLQRMSWARHKIKRVKIADAIDNTRDMHVLSPKGIEKKIHESEQHYIPWGERLAPEMVLELIENLDSYKRTQSEQGVPPPVSGLSVA